MQQKSSKWPKLVRGMMLVILIFSLVACGGDDASNQDGDGETAVTNPTPSTSATTDNSSATAIATEPSNTPLPVESTTAPTPTILPTPTVQTVSITRLDGTVEDVPLPGPTSYNQLLEANIESGDWTEGQGLVQLLRLFTAELSLTDISGAAEVTATGGTAIVHRAYEFTSDDTNDTDTRAEIERLLAMLVPTQETLDLISVPAEGDTSGKPLISSKRPLQATEESCQVLAAQGFNKNYFDGEHCYVYDEAQVNGHRYRVYYPTWWQNDDSKKPLIDAALVALTDSASTFVQYGRFEDVNLMFSLLPDPKDDEDSVTDGLQGYIHDEIGCPLTMFPASNAFGLDRFQQAIAHEAFHCFQDWNFNRPSYTPNAWWLEGSAEFFSNVVYEDVNGEHEYLGDFDTRSINTSLLEMGYENYIFFQYLANQLTEAGVIELLTALRTGNGTADALANYPYANMSQLFQEFVVAYMGPGISDTGGDTVRVSNPTLTRVESVDQEDVETFSVSAFVAARFRLVYEQERRFLQEGNGEGNGRHSMAEFALRQDLGSWSDIPPEVRSSCQEDTPYALVVTTVDSDNQFTFKATVNEMEVAECDPCLLGTWDIDPDSFEAFMLGIFERYGSEAGVPAGVTFAIEVGGHDYVQFLEDGEMITRREAFTISLDTNQGPPFVTTINAEGAGNYSADGKALTVTELVNIVTELRGEVGGISMTQTQSAGTYSFFGNTAAGPGLGDNADSTPNTTATYVCTEETLTITQPDYGSVTFNRVDEILPTPVPTPSP